MRTRLRSLSAVLAATALVMAFSAPVSGADQQTVPVSARAMWVQTGIVLSAGDLVPVKATGQVTTAHPTDDAVDVPPNWGSRNGPAGQEWTCTFFSNELGDHPCLLEGAPYGSLIGRVGDAAFYIGADPSFVSPADGQLELAVNDNEPQYYFDDNAGSFSVQLYGAASPPLGYQSRVFDAYVDLSYPEPGDPNPFKIYHIFVTLSIGQDHSVGPGDPVGRWCSLYVERWRYDTQSQEEQYRFWGGIQRLDPTLCTLEQGSSARPTSMSLTGPVLVDVPFWGSIWIAPSTWTATGDWNVIITRTGDAQLWAEAISSASFSSAGFWWTTVDSAWMHDFVQVYMP